MTGTRLSSRRARATLLGLALACLATAASASRFGVPPGVPEGVPTGAPPPGYLILANSDLVDDAVSAAIGDVAHFTMFYIEVGDPTLGLTVDLYDPGLYDPLSGELDQLDANLNPGGGTGTMRYILFGPDQDPGVIAPDTVLANRVFGADDAGTEKQLVRLWDESMSPFPLKPGLYHLLCEVEETAGVTEDISVFGVSIPDHQVWSYNVTMGHANEGLSGDTTQGGATIAEPVVIYPYINAASPGSDAFGPICGMQVITYDMEASVPGTRPPDQLIESGRGRVLPPEELPPSGDARWESIDVGGIDAGPLDSDDQGIWRWEFSMLSGLPEDMFSNLDPAIDLNAFSSQLLDHGVGDRDFFSWSDFPSTPPFVLFTTDGPRRLYLPTDSEGAPERAAIGHSAQVVAGFPVVAQGELSTLEVTVSLDNPHTYDLTNVIGETHVHTDADILTDPVLTGSTGVVAIATGRRIDFSGTVAAGTTASFTYQVDIQPSILGRAFLTGDGVDFVSRGTNPTTATYETPYTDHTTFERPFETLGPICQLEYESIIPPCAVDAQLDSSEPLMTCPGTDVTLDGTRSVVYNCDDIGGVPLYQWRANGMIIEPFGNVTSLDITVFNDDLYTLEVACSTDLAGCIGSDEVQFVMYEGPVVDAGLDQDVCLGDPASLSAGILDIQNPPLGETVWSTDPPGQDGDGMTNFDIVVLPTQTTTYTFTATDAQGCTGEASVTVTIAAPMPSIAPQNPDICPGETVDLTASPGFASYLWASTPPGLPGDGDSTETIMVTDVAAAATYTVTVTDGNGCEGQAMVVVAPGPEPMPTINPATPQLCAGGQVGLLGPDGFAGYLWSTMPAGRADDGSTNQNVVATEIGVSYTLTVTDARGCTGSTTVTTEDKPPFSPTITPAMPEVCPGDTIALTADAGFVSYLWTTNPAGRNGDMTTGQGVADAEEGVTYTLEVEDVNGCLGNNAVTVMTLPDPLPSALLATLRVQKDGDDDLLISWSDTGDVVSDYQLVSLDCDSDLNSVCDVDPTPTALGTMFDMAVSVAAGVEMSIEADGQNRASYLVYYKVRGRSPCSSTPGPFLEP